MTRTILIVDDEESILESLQEILEHEGYGVIRAGNGRLALAEVARARPSLVLTDFMMPHMNGLQLLAALRAQPELQGLPVVLMSAVRLSPAPGAPAWTAFLAKPFDIEVLLRVIEDALGAAGARTG